MDGQKSPAFLCDILDAVEETLPRARRVEFRDVGHEESGGPGNPECVGEELRAFFSGPNGFPDREQK